MQTRTVLLRCGNTRYNYGIVNYVYIGALSFPGASQPYLSCSTTDCFLLDYSTSMPLRSRFLSPNLFLPLANSHAEGSRELYVPDRLPAWLHCWRDEIDRAMFYLIGHHEGLYQHNKSHHSTLCTYLRCFAASPRTDRAHSTQAQRSLSLASLQARRSPRKTCRRRPLV